MSPFFPNNIDLYPIKTQYQLPSLYSFFLLQFLHKFKRLIIIDNVLHRYIKIVRMRYFIKYYFNTKTVQLLPLRVRIENRISF
jgi:hypothetical protein